ncbi:MAG TPA: lipoyl(octanoyl) transferase LipB [Bdellovibrionales bacterium]|nr:lipoyl(octanoyl) transferase LipB [Bdellovibrionales bacterium]
MIDHRWCGTLSYEAGLKAQADVVERLEAGLSNGEILGLEHSAVVTLGKRGRIEDDLVVSKDELNRLDVQLFQSERGGQATLHAPGQLVIYPCVSLPTLKQSVREYVEYLQTTTRDLLIEQGIDAHLADDEPGVYTSRGKIAYFGVKVSKGIASHGIAINVKNDLGLFRLIRSCGKDRETFDSLQSRGVTMSTQMLFEAWTRRFLSPFA